MRKLYLDTTVSKKSKVEISDDGKVFTCATGREPFVVLDKALKRAGLTVSEIDKIEADPGPGSFTGVRVGAAIVNALNFALGKNNFILPVYE